MDEIISLAPGEDLGNNINTEQMSFINKEKTQSGNTSNKTLSFGDSDFDVPTYLRADRK